MFALKSRCGLTAANFTWSMVQHKMVVCGSLQVELRFPDDCTSSLYGVTVLRENVLRKNYTR